MKKLIAVVALGSVLFVTGCASCGCPVCKWVRGDRKTDAAPLPAEQPSDPAAPAAN